MGLFPARMTGAAAPGVGADEPLLLCSLIERTQRWRPQAEAVEKGGATRPATAGIVNLGIGGCQAKSGFND
jgi:hypothetical protein